MVSLTHSRGNKENKSIITNGHLWTIGVILKEFVYIYDFQSEVKHFYLVISNTDFETHITYYHLVEITIKKAVCSSQTTLHFFIIHNRKHTLVTLLLLIIVNYIFNVHFSQESPLFSRWRPSASALVTLCPRSRTPLPWIGLSPCVSLSSSLLSSSLRLWTT